MKNQKYYPNIRYFISKIIGRIE